MNPVFPHRQLVLGFVCICALVFMCMLYISFFPMPWALKHLGGVSPKMNVTIRSTKNPESLYIGDVYAREAPAPQTHCADGIRAKVGNTPFRKAFRTDVPVLQQLKHATLKEYQRLRAYPGPHGWQGVTFQNLVATLSVLNTTANPVMLDDWGHRSNGSSCIRCAVVGNGGILRGSKKGKEIDQHHYVFRTNGAIIKGFEEDVGSRTSLYTFSTRTMQNSLRAYSRAGFRELPQSKETRYVFLADEGRDYLMLWAAVTRTPIMTGPDRSKKPPTYFGKNVTAEKFKMYHPDFVRYLRNRFLRSHNLKTKYRDWYRPTTGAVMLLAAMHTCDQVSAYGFVTPDFKKYSDHYYDKAFHRLVFYINHDMRMEMKLWQQLHQAGLITLYMR